MPVFNAESFVTDAARSILLQTFKDFELIAIDDGSTDRSSEKLADLASDPRLRVIRNERNLGLVASLNKGVEAARGRFIARMDADDLARPDRLEKQLKWFEENPDSVICGTWFKYIDRPTVIQTPLSYGDVLIEFLINNPFGHPTVMFKKEVLKNLKPAGYSVGAYPAEDYELWMRMMKRAPGGNIGEVLLDYRVHPQQISSNNPKQILKALELRREWLFWIAPWMRFLPERVVTAVDYGLQGVPLRLAKALFVQVLFRGIIINNFVLRRVPSVNLQLRLLSLNPMNKHNGWRGHWARKTWTAITRSGDR